MLLKLVFKNTITYIHVTLEYNLPTPTLELCRVNTFIYKAICVFVQI